MIRVSSPSLEVLHVDSFLVEDVPNGLLFTLKCLWLLLLNVDFGSFGPISYALELVKIFNSSELEISVCSTGDNPEAILKYLDTPSCLKQPLDYLEYVVINDCEAFKSVHTCIQRRGQG